VPARAFADLVGALPQDMVSMALNGAHTLSLQAGRFKSTLKGIAAEEFPVIPGVEGDGAVHIAPGALKEMIDQVVFAAAKDESRPILTGVLARFDGKAFTLVAADGFRLSVRTAHLEEPTNEPIEVVVPARALAELRRVVGKYEEPVAIAVNTPRSQIGFRAGHIELVSQLIDGKFPDYNAIMPKRCDTRAVLDTSALIKACQAAEVFARDNSNTLRLMVAPGSESEPGRVIVQAASAETGDNAGEVDAAIEGAPLEIAFNVAYLIEALKALGAQRVALELTTPSSPGVIRPVADDTFTHLIMPMHLGGR
jgi:DNA polymerase-3 subunit beta